MKKRFNPMNLYLRSLHYIFGGRCIYCKCQTSLKHRHKSQPHAATLDHLQPRSRGGLDCFSNLVLACRACNNRRGNTPLNKWLKSFPHAADLLPFLTDENRATFIYLNYLCNPPEPI